MRKRLVQLVFGPRDLWLVVCDTDAPGAYLAFLKAFSLMEVNIRPH